MNPSAFHLQSPVTAEFAFQEEAARRLELSRKKPTSAHRDAGSEDGAGITERRGLHLVGNGKC